MRTKVLLLLAVCAAAVIGAELPGSGMEGGRDKRAASQERAAASSEIGASVSQREELVVEREEYTYDDTYGYTLWKPGSGTPGEDGGTPVARVSVAYDLEPGGIDRVVRKRISEFPGLRMERETVRVGKEKRKGVAVSTIPGSTPSVEVYVPVDGEVYRINVYGEKLDAKGRRLLSGMRFDPPAGSRSAASFERLPAADDPGALLASADVRREGRRDEELRKTAAQPSRRSASLTPSQVPDYAERRIAEGCWLAASRFFVQTQNGPTANRNPYDGIPTGFTVIGRPNYWGSYTHGNLGYGRCSSPYYTNDKFAIDYPLNTGDPIYSPFRRGTVTFAGRNASHKNYGIFVVIKDANGKYVNLSAHMNGLAPGIRPGATVTSDTIIGYAGASGDPSIPVGEPHLHQAFYRSPGFLADGSPYGGAGLQVLYHRYVGTAARTSPGVYKFGWSKTSTQLAKGSRISN